MDSVRHTFVFFAVLFLSAAIPAQSQVMSCVTAGGINTPVRWEGLSELTGDFILICTGGVSTASGAAVPSVDIQLFTSGTAVTSRKLEGDWSEALLIIDEPAPQALRVCGTSGDVETETGVCAINGTGTGAGVYSGVAGRPNVFQGIQAASNKLLFKGIPVDPPGVSGQRIIRITNIRANTNALGPPAWDQPPVSVFATAVPTPTNLLPITGSATQAIGSAQFGMSTSIQTLQSFKQCESQNAALAADPQSDGVPQFHLRFSELFSTAFRRRNVATTAATPGALANQDSLAAIFGVNLETGFYHSEFPALTGRGNLGLAGLADQGTRVYVRFSSIPAGAKLFAKATVSAGGGADVVRLISTDVNGAGPFTPVAANTFDIAPIPITNSNALLVYEFVASDPTSLTQVNIPIYVAYAAGTPQLGLALVAMGPAPLSTSTTASATAPVARFADTSTIRNAFSVDFCPCTTVNTQPPTFPHIGGIGQVSITAPQSCSWTASSTDLWLHVTSPAQNVGNATVTYTVDSNASAIPRNGQLWVGQDFTVNQEPSQCIQTVTPSANFFGPAGNAGTLQITAPAGCQWAVIEKPSWTAYTSGTIGAGDGVVSFSLLSNAGPANRTGLFRIGAQQVSITQSGGAAAPQSKTAVFNPTQAVWVIDKNGNAGWEGPPTDGFFGWGSANDIPVAGDWDGSGVKKVGVFNPASATWLLDINGNGVWDGPGVDRLLAWGAPGDRPVIGNWNGSGSQDKIGTYNSTQATFTLDYNGNFAWDGAGTDKIFVWGSPGDVPVTGDWSGSGKTYIGIFNPNQGWWVIDANGNFTWDGAGTDRYLRWGSPGDAPIVGDWDGTGTAKLGAYNPAQSVFILDYNGNYEWDGSATDRFFQWGSPGDKPVVGAWNGAGAAKIGIFNPNQGWWLLDYNGNFTWDGAGVDRFFRWGSPGDVPVAGRW